MKTLRSLLTILLVFVALPVGAEDWPTGSEWLEDAESPINTKAGWILLGGTGLTVAVIATEDSFAGPWDTWTAKHQPLGKYSKYGDLMGQILPNALYAGGMWAAKYYGVSKAGQRAWLMVEATAYASLITTVLKYNISEGRPYNSAVGSSFPSGHSTTAFAFAGVVAAEHGWSYGVPAMVLASFVGYSRINDNQHRLHDVIAGATIGLSCAYGLHYAHRARSQSSGTATVSSFQLLPQPLPGGGEVVALMAF